MFHSIMATDAWRAASGNSVKVLLALVAKDNGERNGQISFSCREAADLTGLSVRTCHRCLGELQELGFIRCTQRGAFSRKTLHASLWRYTWQAWPEGKKGPTREFETWRDNGNTRLQVSQSPDAILSDYVETAPLPVADIATEETEKRVVSANSASDSFATHIVYQGKAKTDPEIQRRKQANPTSGPFLDLLRDQLTTRLDQAEPGEQSRIAEAADIPGGTLSKFINGKNLPEHHRRNLAAALDLRGGS